MGKNKKLQIDEDNYINVQDSYNCTLVMTEEKEKADGTPYVSSREYHFPSVSHALRRYLELVQKDAKDVQDCIRITEECFAKIETLKFK